MGCGNSVQIESRQAAVERRRASAALKKLDSKAASPASGEMNDLPPVAETIVVLDYDETPPPPQHTFDPKAQPSQSSLRPSDSITAGSSSAMAGSVGLRKRGISFVNRRDGAASPSPLIVRSPLPKTSDDESSMHQAVVGSPPQRKRRVSDEQLEHRLGDYGAVSGSLTPPLFQPGSHATGSFGNTLTESGENGPQVVVSHSPQPAGCTIITGEVDADGDVPPIASWIQRTSTDSDEEVEDSKDTLARRNSGGVRHSVASDGKRGSVAQFTDDSSRLSVRPQTQQLSSTSSAQTVNSSVAHSASSHTSRAQLGDDDQRNVTVVSQPTS